MLCEFKYLYLTASRCKESPQVSCQRHSYNCYSKLIDAKAMVSVPVDFDSDVYTAVNPDLTGLSNEEAVAHFVKYGVNENRVYSRQGYFEKCGEQWSYDFPPKDFDAEVYSWSKPILIGEPKNVLALDWFYHGSKEGVPKNRSEFLKGRGGEINVRDIGMRGICLVHLYYKDRIGFILPYLINLRKAGFDIFLSYTETEMGMEDLIDILVSCNLDQKNFLAVKNGGRELGGWMTIYDHLDNIEDYDCMCLIHGKKSTHLNFIGTHWLKECLDTVAGTGEVILRNCLAIKRGYSAVWNKMWIHSDEEREIKQTALEKILKDNPELISSEFYGGTIAFTSADIVREGFELVDRVYKREEWVRAYGETETDSDWDRDGQVPHAFERLISYLALNRCRGPLRVDT